jgi:hypothetical protein
MNTSRKFVAVVSALLLSLIAFASPPAGADPIEDYLYQAEYNEEIAASEDGDAAASVTWLHFQRTEVGLVPITAAASAIVGCSPSATADYLATYEKPAGTFEARETMFTRGAISKGCAMFWVDKWVTAEIYDRGLGYSNTISTSNSANGTGPNSISTLAAQSVSWVPGPIDGYHGPGSRVIYKGAVFFESSSGYVLYGSFCAEVNAGHTKLTEKKCTEDPILDLIT